MSDHTAELRAPFPTNTIKVKPQALNQDQTKGLVTYYVDARIVAERLNQTVGAEAWTDEYKVIGGPSEGVPVECRLTVNGVTKCDVGQIAPGTPDDKSWKSAYSDAFKRAAVKFGVGAYLYESPNVWAETKIGNNGKAQGFSETGRAQALAEYAKWIGDSSAPAPQASSVASSAGGLTVGGQGDAAVSPSPSSFQAPDAVGAAGAMEWKWPMGKHKGLTLTDTPLDYLNWFLDNATGKEDIKDRIREFLQGGEFRDPTDIDGDSIPF